MAEDAAIGVIERAWEAFHRQDFEAARGLWAGVRALLPDHVVGYLGDALTRHQAGQFDAAEALLLDAASRFPDEHGPVSEYAWMAIHRRDWRAAIDRFAAARGRFPDVAFIHVGEIQALREIGRMADAEATASRARARFPDSPIGWEGEAQALRNQFEFAAAEAVLVDAIERFPAEPQFMLDHARLPLVTPHEQDKNWPDALERRERLLHTHPSFESGITAGIRMLVDAGQSDRAEQLGQSACAQFPNIVALAILHAETAVARGDIGEATTRYHHIGQRFPGLPDGAVGLGQMLARENKFAEAEATLLETIAAHPRSVSAAAAYAELATQQDNWTEAHRRWTENVARFPSEKIFLHRAYAANMRVSELDPQAAAIAMKFAPAPTPAPGSIDTNVRDLVMQFESLGGRGLGCEFGIFQRDCGAEPLGLLRFSDMPCDMLLFALRNRFGGVGLDENTELLVNPTPGGPGEYCTRDRRGMMFQRTFVYENDMSPERMRVSALRRLRFLADKLIDDLENAAKIFVYRISDRRLAPDEILALHDAIRAYGRGTFLYVQLQDGEHRNGTVELIRPGLLIGYIDRFKISPTDQLSAAPPTGSWLAICRAAHALWTETIPPSLPR